MPPSYNKVNTRDSSRCGFRILAEATVRRQDALSFTRRLPGGDMWDAGAVSYLCWLEAIHKTKAEFAIGAG
jgi:hypothetical protein